MIHFPETHLHGRLELERGAVWFLEKELSHWMIHFPETRLHGIRDPSRMRSLCLQNCWPYFSSVLCLIVVTPSYSAPTPQLSSFIVRALQLCFILGYIVMDQLPMELAMDIAGHITEQSYAPMDNLASLRATC